MSREYGSSINPRDYVPYARRFEAYCRQQGYGVTPHGYERRLDAAAVDALSQQFDAASLRERTTADYLVQRHDGAQLYAEVKARDRHNGSVEIVQLAENVLRSQQSGVPVVYVFVPPMGAMRVSTASAIVAIRRLVSYHPGARSNDRARALLAELGLDWRWQEGPRQVYGKRPDPYIVILARELNLWPVLQDSDTIAAITSNSADRAKADAAGAR